MSVREEAIRAIEAQQAAVKERSPQWMVGEQLKDICRREPRSAELLARDLAVEDMSITRAEQKLKSDRVYDPVLAAAERWRPET